MEIVLYNPSNGKQRVVPLGSASELSVHYTDLLVKNELLAYYLNTAYEDDTWVTKDGFEFTSWWIREE